MRYSQESSAGILNAAGDPKENMFIGFYKTEFMPFLHREEPDILGVSVTYQTHLIPAFTLARMVKLEHPTLPIVFGGAAISRMFHKMKLVPELLRDIDYMVIYEGETALVMLADAVENSRPMWDLPNLAIIERGRVTETGVRHTERLDSLPCPDFDGLPLDQYWSPEIVPLLNVSRGCYWGKCAFCTFSPSTWGPSRSGFRFRNTEKIVSDIKQLSEKHQTRCFNLAIDAMPPDRLVKIADALIDADAGITWDSEVRLEKGFTSSACRKLYESGCRHLRFGFETASGRVGDLMCKGNDLSTTRQVIESCAKAGIAVCLMAFVGFPGETVDEAAMTVEFLLKNSHRVPFTALGEFVLEEGSIVKQSPEAYGITEWHAQEENDLATKYFYQVSSGMTQEETRVVFDRLDEIIGRTYTNRDLHAVGGQGHCHTSLYVSRHALDFILSIALQRREHKSDSLSVNSVIVPARNNEITPLRFDMKSMEALVLDLADEILGLELSSSGLQPTRLDPNMSVMVYQPDKPDHFMFLAPDLADWAFGLDRPTQVGKLLCSAAGNSAADAIRTFVRHVHALRGLVDCEMLSVVSGQ
jgi:radical SAM superfamily enzyme YgiQ (UPF0313 family)